MTIVIQKRGPAIARAEVKKLAEVLGYDAAEVSSIYVTGRGPITVEVFVKIPQNGVLGGTRAVVNDGFAKARITHEITSKSAVETGDTSAPDRLAMTDERLAMIDALASRDDASPLSYIEVRELTDEIRRLKESR